MLYVVILIPASTPSARSAYAVISCCALPYRVSAVTVSPLGYAYVITTVGYITASRFKLVVVNTFPSLSYTLIFNVCVMFAVASNGNLAITYNLDVSRSYLVNLIPLSTQVSILFVEDKSLFTCWNKILS